MNMLYKLINKKLVYSLKYKLTTKESFSIHYIYLRSTKETRAHNY